MLVHSIVTTNDCERGRTVDERCVVRVFVRLMHICWCSDCCLWLAAQGNGDLIADPAT